MFDGVSNTPLRLILSIASFWKKLDHTGCPHFLLLKAKSRKYYSNRFTAQKMKFFIMDFFIFCAVIILNFGLIIDASNAQWFSLINSNVTQRKKYAKRKNELTHTVIEYSGK